MRNGTSMKKRKQETNLGSLRIICQSNTYKKDLNWPHFDVESQFQKKHQLYDQQFSILVSVAYPTCPSSNQVHQPRHGNSCLCKAVWQTYRDKGKPQMRRKKERSKAINEVKPVKNINKNLQKFQGTIDVQKEAPSSHKLQGHPNE